MNPILLLAGVGTLIMLLGSSKKGASSSGSGGVPGNGTTGATSCDVLKQAYQQAMGEYAAALPAMKPEAAEQAQKLMRASVLAMREQNCPNTPPDPTATF